MKSRTEPSLSPLCFWVTSGLGSLFTTGTSYPHLVACGIKRGHWDVHPRAPRTLTLPRCTPVSLGSLAWGKSRNAAAGSQTDLPSNPGSVRGRLGGLEQGSYLLSLSFSATKWVCCEDEVRSVQNLVHTGPVRVQHREASLGVHPPLPR